ncbi:hypothetical protein GCM10010324_43770 [Streptomyces hiroshimensis]|uniref:Uncharacterized protein n=1 Tax=Streptomyces hiroshimensis TaxID=66424 RepID=A0ABQ2YSD0_9ACTN|nr:hypothetical protein GCM10010324_43770 [Streptomyces hiroshimensis]
MWCECGVECDVSAAQATGHVPGIRANVRLDSATGAGDHGDHRGRECAVEKAKKITLWALGIFVAYTIIHSPKRSAELVQIGFEGISDAAKSVGEFMTQLIS